MTPAILLLFLLAPRARLVPLHPTLYLTDRNGAFLTQIANESGDRQLDYGYWPLETLPQRVVQATLALEDRRFQSHPGVDPLAAMRAGWRNLQGRKRSGASTIAMQVARMQQPEARTPGAKMLEAATAVALTLRYGREAVLAQYLRLVPYGNGSHGIAHAARFYFAKPLADLSWAEIALLSGIPQSPARMNILKPDGLARAVRRGQRALDELARQNVIDAAELAASRRQLAAMRVPPAPRRPDALHAVLRFEAMARAGTLAPASPSDPRIKTTLDLDVQSRATTQARRFLGAWREQGAEQVAVMVVERGTGAVLADVGSGGYRDAHAGAVDFSAAPRSPGSALKPFIYALALDRGLLSPADTLADQPEGASGIGNADGHFLGPMLPRQALANSRNVPATNLLRSTGFAANFNFLRRLGLHDLEGSGERFGLSMAIGSLPSSLDRLIRAYGALAEDGVLNELQWFEGQRRREPQRMLSVDSARLVTAFLADPLARLPSFQRFGPLEYPFAVAVKTGTSQGYRDAWTVAWSQKYIVAAWTGRGDAGTMARLSGAGSAARLVHALLLQLHGTRPGDLEDAGFPPPPGREPVELCIAGGKRAVGRCGETLREWLRPSEIPDEEPAGVPLRSAAVASPLAPAIRILSPERDTHLWRNPDAPPGLARIALKAKVDPGVRQVVWMVDGEPFATSDPDEPVLWPLQKGVHHFQVRLPLQPGGSKMVSVEVD